MLTLPTLRQLQYLLVLSETLNFRIASALCHITQPTMSAAIREMENLLGLPVLDRSRRKKVVFTPFGMEVIETARKIMPHLETLTEKARRMAAPLSGPLRLGLIPTIAPYLLPEFLPPLQKQFPNIDFQIAEGVTDNLITRLHEGRIDIALMAFPYETPNLNHKIFFEEPFYCAAKPGTFGTTKEIRLNDLRHHKLLLLEDGHCLRDHALSACHMQDTADKKNLSATSLLTLIQMVDQGYGITLLPEMVIKQGLIPKNVTLYPFKSPSPTRKIGVCWRQKDPQAQDIRTVIAALGKALLHK